MKPTPTSDSAMAASVARPTASPRASQAKRAAKNGDRLKINTTLATVVSSSARMKKMKAGHSENTVTRPGRPTARNALAVPPRCRHSKNTNSTATKASER
jgi:hypothetical protein